MFDFKTGINQTTLLKLLGYEKVLPREIFETGTFFLNSIENRTFDLELWKI
jgi:hypothetical protein